MGPWADREQRLGLRLVDDLRDIHDHMSGRSTHLVQSQLAARETSTRTFPETTDGQEVLSNHSDL
jgi:hypothetical protein